MKTEFPKKQKIYSVSIKAGQFIISSIIILIGLMVLIGWHTGNETLIKILPVFLPMQYNAALGFLLCGVGFLFSLMKRSPAFLIGAILIIFSFLTFIQYPLGVNFGIDELLMPAYINVENTYPGRMSPVAALCFFFTGIAFLLGKQITSKSGSLLFTALLGAVITALGLIALFAYWSDVPTTHGWGRLAQMAFHTAIGIVFIGLGLVALAWTRAKRQKINAPHWLPSLVTIGAITVTFGLWQALYNQEHSNIKHTIQVEAHNLKKQLEMELNTRILTLEQMANRWGQRPLGTPRDEWEADARRYIKDYDSYQAIEWADPLFYIRWVEPEAGNEEAINLNLKTYTNRKIALEYARDNRVTVLTRKHTLSQGGSGIIIYTPIYHGDRFGGFIIGVFRTDELFKSALPRDFAENYSLVLIDEDEVVFQYGEDLTKNHEHWVVEEEINSHGALWKARIFPNIQTIQNLHSPVDEAMLILGLIMSGLLVVAVYFTQEARRRNRESVKTNHDLKYEIMERHRAGEELRISEQHNRDIVEKSLGFICTHKLDGTLLSINPAAANSVGYSPNEMIGKNLSEFIPPSGRPRFEKYLEKIRKTGELSGIFNVLRKSGEIRVWEYKNTLYEKTGEESYILGHAVDITERNQMETELKNARNAAIESARIKAEFLANMSHEIRTPMNGVLGMTELLADTSLDETQREYLETIKKSGESLLGIINDILDFSKMEAGKLRFDKIDFDLRNTVENVVEMFAEQAAGKQIELASLVNSDVAVDLCGDPGRLRQILTNLIGNAVKFTETGEIIVRVAKETETKKTITLRFSIADTGIGIRTEEQKTLFHAFTQADGSITRRFGGTGLGLTISKQLIEMMDGEITVESNFGEGSTFIFTAVFEKQPADKKQKQIPPADLTNLRTLIVDDNETNRKILSYQIKSFGISGEEAEDGKTALDILQTAAEHGNPFNLVILDLLMPEMDGFKLAREIKADSRIKDARIILMPSYGRRGHGRVAKKIDIDGYLIKPIKQADLFDCISAVSAGTSVKPDGQKTSVKKHLVTRHTITENRFKNKELILLVEDNAVNQKLIKIQLERIGYRADIAENGFEALNALKKNQYALVLMDCQMPQMDGYAATEEIRRSEAGEKRIPIIAITANVMPDEIEKCFAAGMDDYLAKPFSQENLENTIKNWLKKDSGIAEKNEKLPDDKTFIEQSSNENAADTIAKTVKIRINELENDIGFEILNEIIQLFIENSAEKINYLREAIKEKDLARIKIEAHGLKGSCGNIGATYIADLCFKIETEAKANNLKNINSAFKEIESLFPELRNVLETHSREILV